VGGVAEWTKSAVRVYHRNKGSKLLTITYTEDGDGMRPRPDLLQNKIFWLLPKKKVVQSVGKI
jgi:hypothetical protein